MALRYCHDCAGLISSDAHDCPHCGKQYFSSVEIAMGLLVAVALLLVMGFAIHYATSNPHQVKLAANMVVGFVARYGF